MLVLYRSTLPTRGFSAIELLVVIGVIVILTALSAPTIASSLRRSRVTTSADAILRATTLAKSAAIKHDRFLVNIAGQTRNYGVAIVSDGAQYFVTVTFGTTCKGDAGDMLMQYADNTKPYFQSYLAQGIVVFKDGSPLPASFGWFHQPRTGYPLAAINAAKTVEIGASYSPNYATAVFETNTNALVSTVVDQPPASELSVRSPDGRLVSRILITSLGFGQITTTP